jgi:hypothetical protein
MSSMIRLWYEPFGERASAMMIALRSGIGIFVVIFTGIFGAVVLVRRIFREQLAERQFFVFMKSQRVIVLSATETASIISI